MRESVPFVYWMTVRAPLFRRAFVAATIGWAIALPLATAAAASLRANDGPRAGGRVLAIAAVPTVATLVFEWTTGITPSNTIRALAGLPIGAGHFWLGRRTKGIIFLATLPLMFAIGLALHGRLFPFDFTDPLVGLEALADLGIGASYFVASVFGYGVGDVRAVTYEYGNAFLVVAGLLNLLVVIDAYDVALGRK